MESKSLVTTAPESSTLLPAPIASVVSLVTRGSSLYLQLGTFIGGLAIDGVRVTTLTGLELSRAIIESVLVRAGKDISTRSTGEIGRVEAEGILERSIATLHSTITSISFAASTGFYISTAALEGATDLSQQLLRTLDGILGSTDSSRAIASIITLIRREFQNPATGKEGEKVSVSDLLMGICGLALLQRWSKRFTDHENTHGTVEEVVWDVVVLDDGRRADVAQNVSEPGLTRSEDSRNSVAFLDIRGNEVVGTIDCDSGEDLPEVSLRQQIMRSLPPDASVKIATSTTTTKMITVEITGTRPPRLSPPSGVEIVEEDTENEHEVSDSIVASNVSSISPAAPCYRAVYRITQDQQQDSNFDKSDTIVQSGGHEDNGVEISHAEDNHPLADLPAPPHEAISSSKLPLRSRKSGSNVLRTKEPPVTENNQAKSSTPKSLDEHRAPEKVTKKHISTSPAGSGSETLPLKTIAGNTVPTKKRLKTEIGAPKLEKKGSFRTAFRKGSVTTLSNLWNKEPASSEVISNKPVARPSRSAPILSSKSHLPVSQKHPSTGWHPLSPQRGNPNFFSSRDLGITTDTTSRSPSRSSYVSVHEQRHDSLLSTTDTYSIHSDGRPVSPTAYRTHLRAQSTLMRAVSEKSTGPTQPSPIKHHRRSKSFVPSIYTLKTNNSETSLVVAAQTPRAAFEDKQSLNNLRRTGSVDGLFPAHHIVRNVTRFIRFASASYGASFLRVMGIAASPTSPQEINTSHHHEHHSFSTHTQLPASTILLSSFVDPQGGSDSSGCTGTGIPMVHFVSLDHDSKAVILTCRGTLGFEDVLTDLTCDYDEMRHRGASYKVHKGIHASAKRLLTSSVLLTITAALEEFPDYGLVLCGHSLGGAVSALLAIMISEPSETGTAFVTAQPELPQLLLPSSDNAGTAPIQSHLPIGHSIHVYAYGPPSCLSPSLRLATRGLITTIVHNYDLVPYLSLGVLHDMQAVALAFKTDDSGAKREVKQRFWGGLCGSFKEKWNHGSQTAEEDGEEDQWAYAALKALRASMQSIKLVPPGEVFVVESMPVLRRDAGVTEGNWLGRPATRVVLRYVRDVEKRFGEVRFGGSMLLDHSPGRYEASLAVLRKGVLDT
ncbi:hypothetical protein BJ878DRAFT_426534 [Calycina marina]|uniref:sn-1-specific diacylglycerol lipase n=1 Tax=Calycina marina TaxID=1763456 RepID=A0A9P8CCM8_9HELO|nr:hypothetical protein BJ878DRAFT_426534 [Calycina marina]